MVELGKIRPKFILIALLLKVVAEQNGVTGRPSDEEDSSYFDFQQPTLGLADDDQNKSFQSSDENGDFQLDETETENFGRLIVTQVGTLMCFRAWELDAMKDFHVCNVCFNSTNYPVTKVGKDDYIAQVESCMNTYLSDTEFKTCQPMLKDPTIPNRAHDILLSEPPFDFPYKNFARCAHGTALKQEAKKCIDDKEVIQGADAFLEKFGCLIETLLIESKKFADANREELLRSVPTSS